SDEAQDTTPTTSGQWTLAKLLVEELKEIGMKDVDIDNNGYVMATLPSNTDKDVPVIGFMAHVDTATDFKGEHEQQQNRENYNSSDITLNKDQNVIMSTDEYTELKKYAGHTLITTDGTTLLGSDNKAGISEIMTAMEYLINHPEIPHGAIRVAFTPDEEIGRGPHKFDVERFNASLAYTVDGGPLGELQFESFNAAGAEVTFYGNNVHPGTAKGKMIHAIKMANQFITQLPEKEAPEYTEGHEGFYHVLNIEGDVENTTLQMIIRDFDKDQFAKRKNYVKRIVKDLETTYGEGSIDLKLMDQYYNMREKIEPVKEVVDIAEQAMHNLQITPIIEPIRGGTDGAQL